MPIEQLVRFSCEESLVKDECHRTLLMMMSKHWFRQWLGVVRQQAITWANVDPELCRHMVPLGHNEIKVGRFYDWPSASEATRQNIGKNKGAYFTG